VLNSSISIILFCSYINLAGRRARKQTDRLYSDETGGRDGKAERQNLKN
jgi:hypothetical protein